MSFGEPIYRPQRNINVLIPEKFQFVVSLSPELQALLEKLVDQQDDRRAALKAAAELKATTEALKDAIPSP